MQEDLIFKEAKRLYAEGFAIHWLLPESKRPVESSWTTGPRASWEYLKETYQKGMNVGVRLGEPSKIKGKYLAVIDVDVKSTDPKHRKEASQALSEWVTDNSLPQVTSGRGNGSRHIYILTDKPLTPFKAQTTTELVKVFMPSAMNKPSKRDLELLTSNEIANGYRMRPAWEIGIMGTGQQTVLPPSIHPDSKKPYAWRHNFKDMEALPAEKFKNPEAPTTKEKIKLDEINVNQDFVEEVVELSWVPITEKMRDMILKGVGVEDRSASLLPAALALYKAKLTVNEILSVLTDPNTFLGACAYEHAQTKSRKRAAAWVYKYTVKKIIEENSAEALFAEELKPARELSFDEQIDSDEAFDRLRSWKDDLEITKDDRYRTNLHNTVLVLENSGEKLFKRDVFQYRDFYGKDTPWNGKQNEALNDEDIHAIKLWLSRNYGFEPSDAIIGAALTLLAKQNAFDPVYEFLESLPAWDEKPRLDTWLKKYFGAKGNDEYLAQVFRKWLVGMIMRIYVPGAKFDWMPIFEGFQGVGKSSFGRLLVGEKYFIDWLPDLNNKDSALALQGVWAAEFGELASFRKNEIETVKAFISRKVDKVRPPYGERWIESPRRCVFFGTTNNETYLRDESGNRRFKPVKVGKLSFDQLIEDREQLFAEAIWLYKHGFETEHSLELDGEAKIYERQIQIEKMVADESTLMQEALAVFIEGEREKGDEKDRFNFGKFRLQELFEKSTPFGQGIGPLTNWRFDSRHAQFAAKALKNLNGQKFKSNGVVYWKMTI